MLRFPDRALPCRPFWRRFDFRQSRLDGSFSQLSASSLQLHIPLRIDFLMRCFSRGYVSVYESMIISTARLSGADSSRQFLHGPSQ